MSELDFQRVSISGEGISGIPQQCLQDVSSSLVQALLLREKYCRLAMHSFPPTTAKYLCQVHDKCPEPTDPIMLETTEESSMAKLAQTIA
ncbi:putative AMP deaminase 3-like [Apostichopus japonicus]|uniref:Putative AMP deaminase 3-like n=1 Tax=Stichopus japonicus TaxID=307972 RepID=A0A2G8JU79_STIJA|nr:putative AMP deaminase 3-like [Apostichopus japonicus]